MRRVRSREFARQGVLAAAIGALLGGMSAGAAEPLRADSAPKNGASRAVAPRPSAQKSGGPKASAPNPQVTARPVRPAVELKSPIAPEGTLAQFRLAPGLAIELVAAEPEIVDPVEARFDEDGRLWVVEMRDYPHGPPPGQPGNSRIRRLEDRDGDGFFETAMTFADHLLFATGLQPYRGGIIATLAGKVSYFPDDNHDGHADREEVWFRGFAEENPQLRANHPRMAMDHRIMVANGLRAGMVVDAQRAGAEPISISGRDFAFNPVTREYIGISGSGQFGLTFDGLGNRFVCTNRDPLIHVVLKERYLKRNPLLAVPSAMQDVAAAEDASRVYPISRAWTTSNLHAGQFTAACGVEIFDGDALPGEFNGVAFVCEPTGNLVHAERLHAHGATFTSEPLTVGSEVLATRDEWFRPVNLEIGPDGALYVVDMYRAVIEHPDWMPEELRSRRDLWQGHERGRIYRVVAAGRRPARVRPKLSQASAAELVQAARASNGWWRETAARLLYERQDRAAEPLLIELVSAGTPHGKIAALWALEGLDALTPAILRSALDDADSRVRGQAVRLSEPWLASTPDLRKRVVELAQDADARLRFQVAQSLGEGPLDEATLAALRHILFAAPDDPWVGRAVGTSVGHDADRLLALVLDTPVLSGESIHAGELATVRELAELVGAGRDRDRSIKVLALLLADDAKRNPRVARRACWGWPLDCGARAKVGMILRPSCSLGSQPRRFGHRRRGWPIRDDCRAALTDAANTAEPAEVRLEALHLLRRVAAEHATATRVAIVARDPDDAVRFAAIDGPRNSGGREFGRGAVD